MLLSFFLFFKPVVVFWPIPIYLDPTQT